MKSVWCNCCFGDLVYLERTQFFFSVFLTIMIEVSVRCYWASILVNGKECGMAANEPIWESSHFNMSTSHPIPLRIFAWILPNLMAMILKLALMRRMTVWYHSAPCDHVKKMDYTNEDWWEKMEDGKSDYDQFTIHLQLKEIQYTLGTLLTTSMWYGRSIT